MSCHGASLRWGNPGSLATHFVICTAKANQMQKKIPCLPPLSYFMPIAFGSCVYQSVKPEKTVYALFENVSHPTLQDGRQHSLETGLRAVEFPSLPPINRRSATNDIF